MSDFFMNDRYRVLECMAQRQIIVNNEAVVKLSQQEIADTLGFTKSKVNSIIRELIQKGYVTQVNARGKYAQRSRPRVPWIPWLRQRRA